MAESTLRFHPVDPAATLDATAAAAVADRARVAFPDAGAVDVRRWESIQCIDNGANLDRVQCPACASDILDEWGELMDAAWAGDGLDDLSIITPCCGAATSLDRLVYEWPMGFGRFSIDVHEPGSSWFTPHRPVPDDAVHLLADLIELTGHRLGVVWRHL